MIRKSISILLLLAVIPLLTLVPATNSQSLTTITNLSTVTSQATFTQASQSPVATTTMTSTNTETIYDSNFVMKGYGILYCSLTARVNFEALTGQRIQGKILSSSPNAMNLYLLDEPGYKRFASANKCDPTETGASPLLFKERVTSYTLDWTAPYDSRYYLLIESYLGGDNMITVSIGRHYSQTVVSTAYSTQTSLLMLTATKTVASLSTQELAAPTPSMGGNTVLFAALGAVIVAALAVAFFVFSRRKQKKV